MEAGSTGRTPWHKSTTIVAAVIGLVGVLITAAVTLVTQLGGSDSAPESLRVSEVALDAPVRSFLVRCPTTLVFEGRISVARGSGDVTYRFVHTDVMGGAENAEPIQVVSFDGPGSSPVRHEWSPTVPTGQVFRTAVLEVISPVTRRSEPVTISGTCDATLPEGPPGPPPDVDPPR